MSVAAWGCVVPSPPPTPGRAATNTRLCVHSKSIFILQIELQLSIHAPYNLKTPKIITCFSIPHFYRWLLRLINDGCFVLIKKIFNIYFTTLKHIDKSLQLLSIFPVAIQLLHSVESSFI